MLKLYAGWWSVISDVSCLTSKFMFFRFFIFYLYNSYFRWYTCGLGVITGNQSWWIGIIILPRKSQIRYKRILMVGICFKKASSQSRPEVTQWSKWFSYFQVDFCWGEKKNIHQRSSPCRPKTFAAQNLAVLTQRRILLTGCIDRLNPPPPCRQYPGWIQPFDSQVTS